MAGFRVHDLSEIERMNMFVDLVVVSIALFLIGWYFIHRFRVRHVEPNGNITAFSTLKVLVIFFLLVFTLGVVAFAFGLLVWFGLGYFFPRMPNESRVDFAATASTMLCLYILVGRPLSLLLEGRKKGDRSGR